jgi:hypothetical protein
LPDMPPAWAKIVRGYDTMSRRSNKGSTIGRIIGHP